MLVNMLAAETQLSKLVEAALRGEEVVIANRGKPMVKLVPAELAAAPRAWGVWEGRLSDAQIDAAFSPEADAAMAADLLGHLQQRALRVAEPAPAYNVRANQRSRPRARPSAGPPTAPPTTPPNCPRRHAARPERAAAMMKRYLLDTHVVIWALSRRSRLSARTLRILDEEAIHVSALSIWEILGKQQRHQLPLPVAAAGGGPLRVLRDAGAQLLPLDADPVEAGLTLDGLHDDPFDRMLVGTARVEQMVLLTRDATILQLAAPLLGPLLQEA